MKTKLMNVFVISFAALAVMLSGFALMSANAQQTACYGTQGGLLQVAASGCEYEFRSGSTLDLQNGTIVNLASLTATGILKYGSVSDVVTGTLFAHTLGTTPTSVLLTSGYDGVLSQTVYVVSSNATSVTIGIAPEGDVSEITTVYWAAGK